MELSEETFFTENEEILVADMDKDVFLSLFPVDMYQFNELEFPEPCIGAYVLLEENIKLLALYGLISKSLSITKAMGQDTNKTLDVLCKEVPKLREYVLWDATYQESCAEVCKSKRSKNKG